jgi:hypothetical protein
MRPGPRPVIMPGVLPTFRSAILGMQLAVVRYAGAGAQEPATRILCPIGILYGGCGWIVAHVEGMPEMRLAAPTPLDLRPGLARHGQHRCRHAVSTGGRCRYASMAKQVRPHHQAVSTHWGLTCNQCGRSAYEGGTSPPSISIHADWTTKIAEVAMQALAGPRSRPSVRRALDTRPDQSWYKRDGTVNLNNC